MTDDNLNVALITAGLSADDDLPEGPCVVLTGSTEAIKSVAHLFGEPVRISPAQRMDVAEAAPDLSDAYVGAMEDKRMWKRRAFEAEAKLRALAGTDQ